MYIVKWSLTYMYSMYLMPEASILGGGGGGGAVAPPMKILGGGGQTYRFAPPIISTTWKIHNI